jgi:hypothetical protein
MLALQGLFSRIFELQQGISLVSAWIQHYMPVPSIEKLIRHKLLLLFFVISIQFLFLLLFLLFQ